MLLEDAIRLHLPAIYHGLRHPLEPRGPHHARCRPASPRAGPRISSRASRRACASVAWAPAVRLQYDGDLPPSILATLLDELELQARGPLRRRGLRRVLGSPPALRGGGHSPAQGSAAAAASRARAFATAPDIWSALRAQDVLVHHPYHAFDAVTALRPRGVGRPEGARHQDDALPGEPGLADRPRPATPPSRTARRSRSWWSCRRASTRRRTSAGPERWRRSGAHVVYGLPGFKTHVQGVSGRPAGERWDPALLPPRDRQLQCPHRGRLQRSRAVHEPGVVRRGPHPALQSPHRLHAPDRLPPSPARARRPARRARRADSPRGRARPGRARPAGSSRR